MTKKKTGKFSSFLNNPIDFTLLITIILLLGIGLIMVLSASSPSALAETGDSYQFFSKQLIFAILGVICMMIISKIDYRFYQKFYKQAWWIALALLVAVKLIGDEVNRSTKMDFNNKYIIIPTIRNSKIPSNHILRRNTSKKQRRLTILWKRTNKTHTNDSTNNRIITIRTTL